MHAFLELSSSRPFVKDMSMFQSATLSQEANIAYFVGILSCAALNYEYLKCIHTSIIITLKEKYVTFTL